MLSGEVDSGYVYPQVRAVFGASFVCRRKRADDIGRCVALMVKWTER